MFKSGELQDYAATVFNLACRFPFNATRSLSDFLDAINQLLRATAHNNARDQVSLQKMALVQLGLGFISKDGRKMWFQFFSCLLYTFERLFKLRKHQVLAGD